MTFNFIDIFFALLFLAIVIYGFFGGVVRLTMILIGLYLSVVVAGLFYVPVGRVVSSNLRDIEPFTGQLLAFILLTLFGTLAIALTLIKTFVTVRIPNIFASVDQIGGATVGLILSLFTVTIVSVIFRVYFNLILTAASNGFSVTPVMLTLALHNKTSFLVAFFAQLTIPIYALIAPWFPGGLPEILSRV